LELYSNKGPHEIGLSTGQNLVKPKLRVLMLSFPCFSDKSFICRVQQALLFGLYSNKGPHEIGLSTGQNLVKLKLRAERFTDYKEHLCPVLILVLIMVLGIILHILKDVGMRNEASPESVWPVIRPVIRSVHPSRHGLFTPTGWRKQWSTDAADAQTRFRQ